MTVCTRTTIAIVVLVRRTSLSPQGGFIRKIRNKQNLSTQYAQTHAKAEYQYPVGIIAEKNILIRTLLAISEYLSAL